MTDAQLKVITDAIANTQAWVADLARNLSHVSGRVDTLFDRMNELKGGQANPVEAQIFTDTAAILDRLAALKAGNGASVDQLVAGIRAAGFKLA